MEKRQRSTNEMLGLHLVSSLLSRFEKLWELQGSFHLFVVSWIEKNYRWNLTSSTMNFTSLTKVTCVAYLCQKVEQCALSSPYFEISHDSIAMKEQRVFFHLNKPSRIRTFMIKRWPSFASSHLSFDNKECFVHEFNHKFNRRLTEQNASLI